MNSELQHQPIPNAGSQETPDVAASEEWSIPLPEKIPLPTYMPIALALGVTVLFWGLTSTYLLSLVGLLLIIISMYFWIGGIHDEH